MLRQHAVVWRRLTRGLRRRMDTLLGPSSSSSLEWSPPIWLDDFRGRGARIDIKHPGRLVQMAAMLKRAAVTRPRSL